MKTLPLIVCLLAAAPAFSQPRVYTNADLGRLLSPGKVTVTPEQLASLVAHQFVALSFARPWDPVVSTGSSPTAGPFGEFRETILPRRLDGSLWTDPPWQSISYFPSYYGGVPYYGRSHYGRSSYVQHAPYAAAPLGYSGRGGRSPGRHPTAGSRAPGRPSRGR